MEPADYPSQLGPKLCKQFAVVLAGSCPSSGLPMSDMPGFRRGWWCFAMDCCLCRREVDLPMVGFDHCLADPMDYCTVASQVCCLLSVLEIASFTSVLHFSLLTIVRSASIIAPAWIVTSWEWAARRTRRIWPIRLPLPWAWRVGAMSLAWWLWLWMRLLGLRPWSRWLRSWGRWLRSRGGT
jgi:hypothetical protein